jgi:hypothetical protein
MTLQSLHWHMLWHENAIFREYIQSLRPSMVKWAALMKFTTLCELYSQYQFYMGKICASSLVSKHLL